jgi:hypothetical protein
VMFEDANIDEKLHATIGSMRFIWLSCLTKSSPRHFLSVCPARHSLASHRAAEPAAKRLMQTRSLESREAVNL